MINIQDIIPFMEDGWVAMDKDGAWCWFEEKPVASVCDGRWVTTNHCISECINTVINIASADDWTKSLIQVKGVK